MFCDVDLSVHYQLVCRTRRSIKSIQLVGIHSQNHTPVSPLHWGPFIIDIINILLFLIIINSSSSSSPSSSSVTLRLKMGQWSFRSRCQICKKLLCTGTQCSTGDQMFLLISIQRWSWYQVATQIFLMMTIIMVHSGKNVARPCHSFEALPKSSRSRPRVVPNPPQVFPIWSSGSPRVVPNSSFLFHCCTFREPFKNYLADFAR